MKQSKIQQNFFPLLVTERTIFGHFYALSVLSIEEIGNRETTSSPKGYHSFFLVDDGAGMPELERVKTKDLHLETIV